MNFDQITKEIENMNELIQNLFDRKGLKVIENGVELGLLQGIIQKNLCESGKNIDCESFKQILHQAYCVKYVEKSKSQILNSLYLYKTDLLIIENILDFGFWLNRPKINESSFEFTEVFLHCVTDRDIERWEKEKKSVMRIHKLLVKTKADELKELFILQEDRLSLEYIDPLAHKIFSTIYSEFENISKELSVIVNNTVLKIKMMK